MNFPLVRYILSFRVGGSLLAAFLFSAVYAPQLLAWPHSGQIGSTRIYSDEPIAPGINAVLARSDSLLKKSSIYSDGYGKRIFLTDGGWRWKLLSFPGGGAFAYSKNLTEAIIINRNSIVSDRVRNGMGLGGGAFALWRDRT